MEKIKFASLTKFHKIFSKSYWGNFEFDENEKDIKSIVESRNKFGAEFKIIKFICNDRPSKREDIFDHCELYKCDLGLIYIISPYLENDALAKKYGFTRYDKLYHKNATTYYRKFNKKTDFNRFIKGA